MISLKNIDIGISGPIKNPNRGVVQISVWYLLLRLLNFQHPQKMTGT